MSDTDLAEPPVTLDDIPREPTQDGPAVRLFLVDGSGYIFRAYHALPPLTRKSDGLPVGAVAGFCNMLWKLICEMRNDPDGPTHLAVIFDASEKTFRNELYDQYKAHRPPPPEDLVPQFALVREATLAFGVPAIELNGYEADDLIATYACTVRDMGGEVVIVSSDKDLMQLVGDRVSMLDTMKNLKIGREQVFEKFGVAPDKVVDVQALCGDSVDNVPGAPGIGIKTASLLINEYGDLDTLLARAGEIKQDKRRQTLIDFADQIRLSRELVKLTCDAPMPQPVDELAVADPDGPTLQAFLELMEFRTLARRVGDGKATDSAPQPRTLYATPVEPAVPIADAQKVDVTLYECVRDEAALDRWIARAAPGRDRRLRHRDRRPVLGQRGPMRGLAGGGAGRGLLHPGRPLRDGRAAARGGEGPRPGPHRHGDRAAEAAARGPARAEGGAERQVRHRRPLPLRDRRSRRSRTPCWSPTCWRRACTATAWTSCRKLWLGHEPISFKAVTGTGKGQKSFKHVELKQATCYAAEDADVTLRLYEHLRPRLAREGLLTVYETLERPLPAVLAAMECAGIRIDPEHLRRLSNEFGVRMGELEAKAHQLAGRPFNLGSPKQIGDLLYVELGMDGGGKKTATGASSTE